MSYNGSGTFNINTAGQPVVTGTVISSTAFNALTADLATGLSTAITKDGQTTTTARIAFAQGVSSTLVTDATSATTGSIITAGGISCQKALWVGTTSRHVGATQFDAAITYGGVTLSNAVTGTGNMVLSASPTLTGTLAAAAATFSGQTVVGTSGAPSGFTPYLYANGLRISGGDTTNTIYQATGALVLSTGSSAAISFAPNVTTVATINGSGLGIGMTPSNALDVTGAASVLTNGAGASGSRVSHNAPASSGGSYTQYYKDLTPSYVAGIGTCVPGGSAASALIFSDYTGSWTERMRLTSTGLGIGMTPSNVLDITKTQNSGTVVNVTNANTSSAAYTAFQANNSTSYGGFYLNGTGVTLSGINRPDGLKIDSNGTGGITINTAAAQPIYFGINSTEVARFDTSGRLIVGTITPEGFVTFVKNSPTSGNGLVVSNGVDANVLTKIGSSVSGIGSGTNTPFYFCTNNTERARIGTDGSFLVNTTTNGGWTGIGNLNAYAASGRYAATFQAASGASGIAIRTEDNPSALINFFYSTGVVGSITTNGSATAYNTSSDARLKDNIADAGDAGAIIDALRVRQWDWKSTGLHQAFGFVAQEEAAVYPDAVTAGDDGDEIERQWSRDDSKLVPLLVKEIQSLRQRLAAAGIA